MALYEYVCLNCGHKFEEAKPVDDRLEARCPKCNGKSKLVPSLFEFSFKGGV